ncbi:MAG: aminotransferase class V-fold PLP-dependent enzyme [Bacillota bacterium]|nr:aminotransferase class V-fold PLP-dependent enzyme [Bacillota bacterium]
MPLLEALLAWEQAGLCSFHTPGHRQGREVAPEVAALLPERLFRLDATELEGLDDLHNPAGLIARAQRSLAELYGADESFFLVGGTTAGILAAVLAAGGPGRKLLMARHSHRAAFAAAILSGCRVRYLPEEWTQESLPLGPLPEEAAAAVEEWRPGVLLLTRPNYYGIAVPLDEVAGACRRAGTVLVVDEAHGARWGPPGLPSALQAGADVVVQSAHKTLPALTQGAWLHVQGPLVDRRRLRACLRVVQSSSPSYLLMVSLDVARWHLARWLAGAPGQVEQARRLRESLAGRGVPLLPRMLPPGWVRDPFRLVVDASAMGRDGREVAAALRAAGMEVEWAEPDRVLILLGMRVERDARDLADALGLLVGSLPMGAALGSLPARAAGSRVGPYPRLEAVLDPAPAWWADQEEVPLQQAPGRVAGEMIYLSPPGVPLVAPGERWTGEAVAFLRRCREAGLEAVGGTGPPAGPQGEGERNLVRVVRET